MKLGFPEFREKLVKGWAILRATKARFLAVDGMEWAAAFSFNAFFSLFPLMVLLVTIASIFITPHEAAQAAIGYLGGYVPIDGEMRARVFEVISGVLESRAKASVIALVMLVWTSLQCFTTLISVTNTAWGFEPYKWWKLPLKSLGLLALTAIPALLAMAFPVVAKLIQEAIFPESDFRSWSYSVMLTVMPLALSLISLAIFYKLAPSKRVEWKQVLIGALAATALLQIAQSLFVVYLTRFAGLNALYGAFGGVMALLLWVYISGCIFIFGAALCSAQVELDDDFEGEWVQGPRVAKGKPRQKKGKSSKRSVR